MSVDRYGAPIGAGADNYYEVLGVGADATPEEIEAAYTDLSRMFAAANVPAARQDYARKQRIRLATAYAVLGDPETRAGYDARQGGRPAPAPAGVPAVEPVAPQLEAAPAPQAAKDTGVPVPPVAPEAAAVTQEPSALKAAAPPAEADAAPQHPSNPEATPFDSATLPPVAEATEMPVPLATQHIAPAPAGPWVPTWVPADEDTVSLEAEPDDVGDDEDALDEAPDYPDEQATTTLSPVEAPLPPAPVLAAPRDTERVAPEAAAALPAQPRTPPRAPAPPARGPASSNTGVRVAPARPATRPAPAPPPPAPRSGGVALPTRREAAQITGRPPAPAPAPGTRPGAASRRPVPRPEYEEEEDYRARPVRSAPAPAPVRKRRRRNNSRFASQVMILVISVVLVLGSLGTVLSSITTGGTTAVVTTGPNAASLVSQGDSMVTQKQWALAEQAYQGALSVDPQNVAAMYGLAQVYSLRVPPDLAQARNYAEQVIKTAPNSPQAAQAIQILAALSQPTPGAGSTPATNSTPAATGTGGSTPAAATPVATAAPVGTAAAATPKP